MHPSGGSQQLWTGLTGAWSAVSYPISGIALWGGAGFWLDATLGTKPVFGAIGVLIGYAAGVYLIFVRSRPPARGPDHAS